MKLFKNLLGSVKPHFEKGGKLDKLYPAYDSFETFLFVPDHTTHKGAHVRDAIDLKRTMFLVIIALVPCLLFGMWNVGYQYHLAIGETATIMENFIFGFWKFLPLIIVSYAVGLAVEFAFAIYRGHSVNEGYLVTGLLIPLTMPIDVPLWMLAISVIFAVVIGKEVFGGTGMNVVNVALTTRAFLFFAHPTSMSGNTVWISGLKEMKANGTLADGVSGATPLGDLASMTTDSPAYANIQDFTENGITFSRALMGDYPGSIGESSVYAILIGLAFLLMTRIASWRIIVSFFAGGFVMATIFNLFAGDNAYMQLPAIHQLMMGSFMFGMVFMITDPVTAAQTNKGKFYYGFLAGFIGILIRVANPAYPEGIMLGILIANVCSPLIDHMVLNGNIKRREKRLAKASL